MREPEEIPELIIRFCLPAVILLLVPLLGMTHLPESYQGYHDLNYAAARLKWAVVGVSACVASLYASALLQSLIDRSSLSVKVTSALALNAVLVAVAFWVGYNWLIRTRGVGSGF